MGRLKVLHETIGMQVTPVLIRLATWEYQSMIFAAVVNAQLQVGMRRG